MELAALGERVLASLVWLEPGVSVLVGRPLGGFLVPTESRVHV